MRIFFHKCLDDVCKCVVTRYLSMLQCDAVCCSALQCVAVSVQSAAARCSVLQCTLQRAVRAYFGGRLVESWMSHGTHICARHVCDTLQHTATCCNMLQHTTSHETHTWTSHTYKQFTTHAHMSHISQTPASSSGLHCEWILCKCVYVAVWCSMRCSVLHYSSVWMMKDMTHFYACNVLCWRVILLCRNADTRVFQCVAVHCSVLQCVAVCCSVLQCVAVCKSWCVYISTCCMDNRWS